jgi:GTP pyrophosphokinase
MVKLKDRHYFEADMTLIREACVLSQLTGEDHPTFSGESCLRQGLSMADILVDLQVDKETLAAAIVYNSVHFADLSLENVTDNLGPNVAKLIQGVEQLDAIRSLQGHHERNRLQIENLRKMLLAMVEDVRVVLIKLAERACIMRSASVLGEVRQRQLARETMDIYAPLANRLGIGQLKWELEDLAFRYLEPVIYKDLAKRLDEKRIDRENYVKNVIAFIKDELTKASISPFEISGRVKHIYSIYGKMVRKELDYDQIYDVRAVRILVSSIESCYEALSTIHQLWNHVPEEFDDYIATPKENGYRSLHTVVIGPEGKHLEVQIRTFQMHQEAELGVAAHWVYKEGAGQKAGYEGKIAWLRQLLEWQKGLESTSEAPEQSLHAEVFADRIYVFTPTGDIVDLPEGATPLDFGYHIHSEVGHRCRGAKVNGNIVPLTYRLSTGERVEILTGREANPSRDWLNPHLGYLKSSRARAKVHHWFKSQDADHHLEEGRDILEKELRRLDLRQMDYEKIAEQLNYKNSKEMMIALGCGDIRINHILNTLQTPTTPAEKMIEALNVPYKPLSPSEAKGINVEGVGNLLTHTARCCQAVPGDSIIGFITQGRGVSIHRTDCSNVSQLSIQNPERLIEIQWGSQAQNVYPAVISISAYDRQGLLRDITTVLTNERINVLAINSSTDKTEQIANIAVTIEISGLESLSKVLDRLNQLPNVLSVKRQGDHPSSHTEH